MNTSSRCHLSPGRGRRDAARWRRSGRTSDTTGGWSRGHCQLVGAVRRYGHGWDRLGRSLRPVSGGGGGCAGDLVPGGESGGHLAAVLLGAEAVTVGLEVRGDAAERGEEPLGVPG